MRIHQPEARRDARQLARQALCRLRNTLIDVAARLPTNTLQPHKSPAIDKRLQPQRLLAPQLWQREQHRRPTGDVGIAANRVLPGLGTQSALPKPPHVRGAPELEAIIDPRRPRRPRLLAHRGRQRVQQPTPQPRRKRDARPRLRHRTLRLKLHLPKRHIPAERAHPRQLRSRLEKIPPPRQQRIVPAVPQERVAQRALDTVARVAANNLAGALPQPRNLPPHTAVADLVLAPLDCGAGTFQGLFVVGVVVVAARARVAANLGDDARVCEDGRGEVEVVGGARACADGGRPVERLGAAKDVAVGEVDVACALGVADVGAGLEQQPGLFGDGEEDAEVCVVGGGGRLLVEVDADCGVEDAFFS